MTQVFTATPKTTRILGLAGTGKTETLITHIEALLNQGVSISNIQVFCATTDACATFKTRLEDALGKDAKNISIATAHDLAINILSSEEAFSYTGRKPRMLTEFEENFLLEDMKVGGLRPRRLREILKFFYRSWTELADDDENWLITSEERETHDLIKKNLNFVQGMLEPELASFACKYLRDNKQACEQFQVPHVLVDDYQCFNRASQAMLNTLASESITIAGHPCECVEVGDPYPYAAGIEELKTVNPEAEDILLEVSHLPAPITNAVNNLLADESMACEKPSVLADSAPEGSLTTREYTTFHHEFDGIADLVAESIKKGTKPADIFIVSPNKIWNQKLSGVLKSRNIAFDALPDKQTLKGDIRDYAKCAPLRMYTMLQLVANPEDAVAWRSWCGYGDYLTNSAVISDLRTYAEEHNINLYQALLNLAENPHLISESTKVLSAYRAGQALLKKVEGFTGSHLLESLGNVMGMDSDNPSYKIVRVLCLPFKIDGADATTLAKNAAKNLLRPRFDSDRNAVKIGSSQHVCGLSPQLLIFSGFVNGFFPDRDYFDGTKTTLDQQKRIHAKDVMTLYATAGKARKDLVFSYFIKTDLESAERLKLEIERIRLDKGVRMCIISPSEFLEVLQS